MRTHWSITKAHLFQVWEVVRRGDISWSWLRYRAALWYGIIRADYWKNS